LHYPDGQVVLLGDVVSFVNDRGVVVGLIESRSFLPPYSAGGWTDKDTGLLVRTDRGALVQFADDEHLADMSFVLERRRDL
jgi:hypothetical protein